MNIRHINRGDVKDGGCPLCKPRHKREDDIVPVFFVVQEGLEDFEEEREHEDELVPY